MDKSLFEKKLQNADNNAAGVFKDMNTPDDPKKEIFKQRVENSIYSMVAQTLNGREEGKRSLSFIEAKTVSLMVRRLFINRLGTVPAQVETACLLSEALMAPDTKSQEELFKTAIGVGGGLTGIGLVIAAIGTALGWGAGIIATVSTVIFGVSMTGPIGLAILGVLVAALCSYYVFKGTEEERTITYISSLTKSVNGAIDSIWPELGDKLKKDL